MTIRTAAALVFTAWCLPSVGLAQKSEPSLPEQLEVSIDTQQTAAPISKYLYGGFIEHGGMLMYRSLWAEMIDDRKFYFPITSQEPPAPARRAGGGFRGMQLHRWHPVGPDQVVVMDKDRAFVGDQSPRIELGSSDAHGIRQSGIALVSGKKYSGRIYLRGNAGSVIKVSLIWGDGGDDRQTLTFNGLSGEYRKYPLQFTAKADTTNGAIEITGTGSGSFHIGTLSLMPTDNVQGFRPDTIALLRGLHAGMWRMPGGNFISDWDWHNSVGDIDKRPPVFDYAWNAAQSNDLGMDELMILCKLVDVDPYITVNAGFGDANSAAQEVEYLNGSVNTRWGAARAKDGHPEPYHVKFWNIGNEPYGSWQLGHTDLKYYVIKHNDFAKAMRAVDPSITLLASGAMPDEMTVEGQPKTMGIADPQVKLGSDIDWTNGLLKNCMGNFDGLTEHWYTRAGKYFDYEHAKSLPLDSPTEAGYVDLPETTLEFARHPANRVHKKGEEWSEYEKLYPAIDEKKIFLSIDEYGYGQSTLKATLAYGMILNEMFRHTEFLKMAAYTMSVSTLDYNSTAAKYNSRGLLYKMYREHFGTIPVELSGNSPQPAPTRPPYGDQPKTSSGSSTYPLDMIATLTDDRKYLTVAVVNATDRERGFDLSVAGMKVGPPSMVWQLSGSDLNADNHVGEPEQVFVKEIPLGEGSKTIAVATNSVNIYRFSVQ